MSKRNKARKGREDSEKFVYIPNRLIESAAWRSLSPRAVCAYVHLLYGWRAGNAYVLPVRSISWRMSRATRQKALAELLTAGLIDCLDPGACYPPRPAKFKLSERWQARSRALILDEAAGRAQGKLGLWTPTRKQKGKAAPQLFKKATAKRPRPTKAGASAGAAAFLDSAQHTRAV